MRAFVLRVVGSAATLVVLSAAVSAQAATVQGNRQNGASAAVDPITAEGYILPPEPIRSLVLAPRDENALYGTPSPVTRRWFVRTLNEGMPILEHFGKPYNNLAGWQIDPAASRARTLTSRSNIGYEFFDWAAGKTTKVLPPNGARAGGSGSWSPDGKTFAYLALFEDATHIYLADPATGNSRPLTRTSLLATNVTNFEWTADGRSIIAVMVPDGRGPEPVEKVASSPQVRVNENRVLKSRTHFDLIQTPHEQNLVKYYSTGQLALIDVRSRNVKKIGEPGMIRSLEPSPDGKYFRVTYVTEPFSYLLPVSNFGTVEVIVDETGKVLHQLSKRDLNEGQPTDVVDPDDPPPGGGRGGRGGGAGADTGRRNISWHPHEQGLTYFQYTPLPRSSAEPSAEPSAGRGGGRGAGGRGAGGRGAGGRGGAPQQPDSAALASRMDRLMLWAPPFDTASMRELYRTEARRTINAVRYSDNGRIMFISEGGTGGAREIAVFLDENNQKYTLPSAGDTASAQGGRGGGGRGGRGGGGGGGGGGGSLEMTTGTRGLPVVMMSADGRHVFRRGTVPDSSRGPRPYVEKVEIKTGARTRIYESTVMDLTETIGAPLDGEFGKFLVTRQSSKQPAQQFIMDAATKQATLVKSTRDLMPNITNVVRKDVTARRADGYTFRVRVTLPHDYREGSNPRYPALFWFYPREYNSQAAYDSSGAGGRGGGRGGAPNAPGTYPGTPGVRSMSFLTAAGYALVEPDSPIFASEGQLPNDNYIDDLRNNLAATIDALDTLGYIDRHRLAIGGHSYGAFSTVNAMTNTPFFKAGIAGDGMYNRTLTPNGFQSERRDLWQAQDVYLSMSPFLRADKMVGALLMYHGAEDQNVGTNPISSERMYHALMGQGKNVALYMYPYEDHGPAARETVLDQWARWVAWLDKYVKNAEPPKVAQ